MVTGGPPALSLTLRRDPAELTRLAEAVDAFLAARPALSPCATALQLVLEELVSNVIRHAGPPEAALTIGVDMRETDEGVTVRVEDDGPPFDPLAVPPPDISAPLEERPVGGLGLHLVRHMARDLAYARHDGRNVIGLRIPRTG